MKLTNVTVDKLNTTSIDAVFPEYLTGNTKICYMTYATKGFQLLGPSSMHAVTRLDPGHRPEIPSYPPMSAIPPKLGCLDKSLQCNLHACKVFPVQFYNPSYSKIVKIVPIRSVSAAKNSPECVCRHRPPRGADVRSP